LGHPGQRQIALRDSKRSNQLVQISRASTFTLGPGVLIDGNLLIQNVLGTQLGVVCGTTVKGNLQVQNNTSPIQIGETPIQQNCPGNTVSGNLQCTGNNPVPTSGSNTVTGHTNALVDRMGGSGTGRDRDRPLRTTGVWGVVSFRCLFEAGLSQPVEDVVDTQPIPVGPHEAGFDDRETAIECL
jgi:hypothetical protein